MKDGALHIDAEDEITRETLMTRGGEVVHARIRELLGGHAPRAAGAEKGRAELRQETRHGSSRRRITIFVLAIFVGFEVITKVPPTLHTPLMSGSNAITGITVVGAILSAGTQHTELSKGLGFAAIVFATINVVGGFLVTHRMLGMFRRK